MGIDSNEQHPRPDQVGAGGYSGNPEYGCELHPVDFAEFAQACGGTGFRIEDRAECGNILDQALATRGPAVIEAKAGDDYEIQTGLSFLRLFIGGNLPCSWESLGTAEDG
jgi:hypothetical protein